MQCFNGLVLILRLGDLFVHFLKLKWGCFPCTGAGNETEICKRKCIVHEETNNNCCSSCGFYAQFYIWKGMHRGLGRVLNHCVMVECRSINLV